MRAAQTAARPRSTHPISNSVLNVGSRVTVPVTAKRRTGKCTRKYPRVKNLEQHIAKPFTRLDKNTWLHDRPEKDVYKLLIDAFRMRQEDCCNFDGQVDKDTIYTGAPDSLAAFRKFLQLTSTRANLLPSWWSSEKQQECEEFGLGGNWSNLKRKVNKAAIQEHYGEDKMPMQLRMFGEAVYGRGPGGSDGKQMRQMLMSMEKGGSDGRVYSMMSVAP
ncbi:hypothetical protein G7Y79_00004g015360 [Physcia stellaris]|nr:hypothetical protein G7Y79_00004g015360 [Physcia stellaris]